MAKLHVLDADLSGKYRIVAHYAVPGTNNSAGIPWKTALLNSGRGGMTVLAEGTGAGQITTAEKAQVIAGDVVEFTVSLQAESGGYGSLAAAIEAMVDAEIVAHRADLQMALKYFGYTRG